MDITKIIFLCLIGTIMMSHETLHQIWIRKNMSGLKRVKLFQIKIRFKVNKLLMFDRGMLASWFLGIE